MDVCQKMNRERQLVMVVVIGESLIEVGTFRFLFQLSHLKRHVSLFFCFCLFVCSNGESPDGDFTPDSHKSDDKLKSLGNVQTYRSVLLF